MPGAIVSGRILPAVSTRRPRSRLDQYFDAAIDRTSLHIADRLRVRCNQMFDFGIIGDGHGWLPAPCEYDFGPMRLDLCRGFAGKCGIELIARGGSFFLVDGHGQRSIGESDGLSQEDVRYLAF